MPWARFEDDFLGNQKLATLSTAAIALDMASIIYSARELRDGQLTVTDIQIIATLIHIRRWQPIAAELVRVNRWSTPDDGDCYAIHDYLDYQPSRHQVLTERAAAADRMRRVRANTGRTSGERSAERSGEVRKKFGDPVPGPGPGPERSTNVPLTSPLPPPQAEGETAPQGATNGSLVGSTVETVPMVRHKRPEPPADTACCPNIAAGSTEHWAYCPNAPVDMP
jgi:hypothetical protein